MTFLGTSLAAGTTVLRQTPQGVANPAADKIAVTCVGSPTVQDVPPSQPGASPSGRGSWYVNADRTIWAGWDATRMVADQSRAGQGNKVLWIRPAGTQLEVTGRRLDGDAGPLRAFIPCCYRSGFQASGLAFPAAGCWEIQAKAGKSTLSFVTRVR